VKLLPPPCKHFLRQAALQPSRRFNPETIELHVSGQVWIKSIARVLDPAAFLRCSARGNDHAGWRRYTIVDRPNPMQDFMACFACGTCTGWMACEKTLAGLEQVIQ
jgi:hypothetical protein